MFELLIFVAILLGFCFFAAAVHRAGQRISRIIDEIDERRRRLDDELIEYQMRQDGW